MNKHEAWDLLQEGACFSTVLPALALLILLAMTEV